jgi:uncharacterized protein (DUF2132 family)
VSNTQPKNPLHGVKLEMILTDLVKLYGREELGQTINIKCFIHEPSIKSSLKFLRTPGPGRKWKVCICAAWAQKIKTFLIPWTFLDSVWLPGTLIHAENIINRPFRRKKAFV